MDVQTQYLVQVLPYWDWRVAMDLFLGGMGVGAIVFAVLLDRIYPQKHFNICRTGVWLGPILVAAGLVMILGKLGRPENLLATYKHVNLLSPLWWGGIFQPLLVILGFWHAWTWDQPGKNQTLRKILGNVVTLLAIIVGTYHGLLLSVMPARPLWNTGAASVSALLAFASTGIAAVLLVHVIKDRQKCQSTLASLIVVRNFLAAVLVLQLTTFFFWWLALLLGDFFAQHALASANLSYGNLFWYVGIGIGLISPLIIGGLVIKYPFFQHEPRHTLLVAISSIMILMGGYAFRFALIYGGQTPKPLNFGL